MLRAFVLLLTLFLVSACAEPPSKEMHQAQGAIDAARAAGAEQYGAEQLKAAVDALAQADVAVTANDYRLALANALNSREHAQNAAKTAVDARARARGDAERELAEATALVERADTRLKAPDTARLPARVVAPVRKTVDAATIALQEARTALEKEEYVQVGKAAAAVTAQIEAALATLDQAPAAPARSRKR
jgi:hypothetical protein